MDFQEVAPGLRYWLAPHPDWRPGNDWPEEVLYVEYVARDALALIDPLVPRGKADQLWEHAQRLGLPVRVLLTAPWHRRDAALFPDAQLDGEPPAGIETFVADGVQEGQRAFFIGEHRTLVVAEYFMGVADGLRFTGRAGSGPLRPLVASTPRASNRARFGGPRAAGALRRRRAKPRGARIRLTIVR